MDAALAKKAQKDMGEVTADHTFKPKLRRWLLELLLGPKSLLFADFILILSHFSGDFATSEAFGHCFRAAAVPLSAFPFLDMAGRPIPQPLKKQMQKATVKHTDMSSEMKTEVVDIIAGRAASHSYSYKSIRLAIMSYKIYHVINSKDIKYKNKVLKGFTAYPKGDRLQKGPESHRSSRFFLYKPLSPRFDRSFYSPHHGAELRGSHAGHQGARKRESFKGFYRSSTDFKGSIRVLKAFKMDVRSSFWGFNLDFLVL